MRCIASAAAAKKCPRLFYAPRPLDIHQPAAGFVDQAGGLEHPARLLLC